MLQRIKDKAGSWIIKVVLVLVSLSFVLWGTSSIWNLFLQEDVLLEINGETFSASFFENQVANYKQGLDRQNTGVSTASQRYRETAIREEVLAGIINATLIRQAADEEGVVLSDRQLDQVIVSQPDFHVEGKFNQKYYSDFLARSRITSAYYKNYINNDYKINSYTGGIVNSALFVPSELDFYANWKQQEYNYHYLKLDSTDFITQEDVDEQALRSFYEENIEDYYLPEEFSIRYYTLATDDFVNTTEISDDEIQTVYFDRYGHLLEAANVTLRQIFLADEEGINLGLEEQLDGLKPQISIESDFISLAGEQSEDEQTAQQGGLLGEFVISDLPRSFVEAIGNANKGQQLLGPVRTVLGVHLLWVVEREEVDIPDIADVRDELIVELQYSKVDEVILEKAENFSYEILNLEDLDRAAANSNIEGVKEQTFVIGDAFAEQLDSVIIQEILAMNEGDTSDVLFLNNGDYLALELVSKQEETLLPFAEVIVQIEQDYLKYVAVERTKDLGEQIVVAISSGDRTYSISLHLLPAEIRDKYSWTEVSGRSRSNADEVGNDMSRAVFALDRESFPYGGANLLADNTVEVFMVDGILEKKYDDLTTADQLIVRAEYLENSRHALNALVISSLRDKADIQVNEELAGVR